MKREALRIVAVMMVVVLVSMCWMTPISYAWVLVDDLLVILVGGLLITCGVVFASDAQMQSAIQYAISNMPSDLRQSLDNVIYLNFGNSGGGGGGNKDPKKNFRQILEKIAGTVSLSVKVFNQFKTWATQLFGINEQTAAAGSVTLPDWIAFAPGISSIWDIPFGARVYYDDIQGKKMYSPELPLQGIIDGFPSFPYVIFAYQWVICSDRPLVITRYGQGVDYCEMITRTQYWSFNKTTDSFPPFSSWKYSRFNSEGNFQFIIDGVFYSNYDVYSFDGSIYHSVQDNQPLYIQPSYGLSSEAYGYGVPDGQEEISISIPEELLDMIDKNYRAILDDYSLENMDWQKSLEDMRGQYESLKDSLGALGMAELEHIISLLQAEIYALNQAVETLGVDGLGGLDALNDALVDSAWVLNDLKDAVKANEAASAGELAAFRDELAQALEKIQELLNAQTDPGTDPGVEPPSSGEIDWSILLGIKIFDKFPFSLPSDIMAFVEVVAAPPKEPVFEFDIFGGMFGDAGKITLDFKQFEDIRLLIRNAFLILLVVGLIGATKQYIWTGGG